MQELTFEQVEEVSGGVSGPRGETVYDPRQTIEKELKENSKP